MKVWGEASVLTLQGCFEYTDWEVFECLDIDEYTEVVASYINSCIDNVIPTKQTKTCANTRPWVSVVVKKASNWKRTGI